MPHSERGFIRSSPAPRPMLSVGIGFAADLDRPILDDSGRLLLAALLTAIGSPFEHMCDGREGDQGPAGPSAEARPA